MHTQAAPELCRDQEDVASCGVHGTPTCAALDPPVALLWGDDNGDGCFDQTDLELRHSVYAAHCPDADTIGNLAAPGLHSESLAICAFRLVDCNGTCTRCSGSTCATACDSSAPPDDTGNFGDETGGGVVVTPEVGPGPGFDGGESGECAALWEQCGGGMRYNGATCCRDGLDCVRNRLEYAQCRPNVVAETRAFGGAACGTWYQQCGGKGWTGTTCCEPLTACTVVNTYFSQCRPLNRRRLLVSAAA